MGKLLFNELTEAEVLEVDKLPPKNSTASSNSTLDFFTVPLLIKSPAIPAMPALSPSLNPSTSNASEAVTLGSLVFLTTKTCKPFAKVYLTGLAI